MSAIERVEEPVISVYHARLGIVTDSSQWRRECPFCDRGMFLVGRDRCSFELQEYDHCIGCGQRVRYMDIEQMREKEAKG